MFSTNIKFYGISGQLFGLISSFLGNRWLLRFSGWEVFTKIFSYVGVLQGFILGSTLFLLYINDFPDDLICNIVIYADDTTLFEL